MTGLVVVKGKEFRGVFAFLRCPILLPMSFVVASSALQCYFD